MQRGRGKNASVEVVTVIPGGGVPTVTEKSLPSLRYGVMLVLVPVVSTYPEPAHVCFPHPSLHIAPGPLRSAGTLELDLFIQGQDVLWNLLRRRPSLLTCRACYTACLFSQAVSEGNWGGAV